MRDDAPARDVPRFAIWESGLHERVMQVAEAAKDHALFSEARRLVISRFRAGPDRDAQLRLIAAAEARAGLIEDAARTVKGMADPGPVPAEIATFLARAGRLRAAIEVVEQTASSASRSWAWIRLAQAVRDHDLLDKAATTLRDVADDAERNRQLRHLAIRRAELGDIAEARRVVREITVGKDRATALAEIGRLTGDAAPVNEAKERVLSLDDRLGDPQAWRAIIRAEIALGRWRSAAETLRRPELELQPDIVADGAGQLAVAYWVRDGQRKAEDVLNDAMKGYGDRFWGQARYQMVVGLADAGRFDSALLMAFMNDEGLVDAALSYIAIRQGEAHAFNAALDTADKVKDPGYRSPALAKLSAMLLD
jgi:tetratricopeptide (TPR) repeat protein